MVWNGIFARYHHLQTQIKDFANLDPQIHPQNSYLEVYLGDEQETNPLYWTKFD